MNTLNSIDERSYHWFKTGYRSYSDTKVFLYLDVFQTGLEFTPYDTILSTLQSKISCYSINWIRFDGSVLYLSWLYNETASHRFAHGKTSSWMSLIHALKEILFQHRNICHWKGKQSLSFCSYSLYLYGTYNQEQSFVTLLWRSHTK